MSDGSFQQVTDSEDKLLYGPRKLLLCGFSPEAQDKMVAFLKMIHMDDVPRVWASESDGEIAVEALMARPDDEGRGRDSTLPRAIVMAGITEKELHTLVDACRQAGMRRALFAVLTPVSALWTLGDLIRELGREREALSES